MSPDSISVVRAIFEDATSAHQRFAARGLEEVASAAAAIGRAVGSGRKVLAFGNGGSAGDAQHLVAELGARLEGLAHGSGRSAGDAQHLVAELVGRFGGDRRALAAVALATDSTVMTA